MNIDENRAPAIRLPDGREVGTDTLEIVRAHYPDAEWIGYQDGERFEEARPLKATRAKAATPKDEAPAEKTDAKPEPKGEGA